MHGSDSSLVSPNGRKQIHGSLSVPIKALFSMFEEKGSIHMALSPKEDEDSSIASALSLMLSFSLLCLPPIHP